MPTLDNKQLIYSNYTYYYTAPTFKDPPTPDLRRSHVGRFIFSHKGKKKRGKPNHPPLGQELKERRKMPEWRGSRKRLNAWLRDSTTDKRRIARNKRRPSNVIHAEHLFTRRRWLNLF